MYDRKKEIAMYACGRRGAARENPLLLLLVAPHTPPLYPFLSSCLQMPKFRISALSLPSLAVGEDSELLRRHFWDLLEVLRANPKKRGSGTFFNKWG